MSIYKPCDIRGNTERELTPELYRSWGQILGRQVQRRRQFVVGGDVRGSTPDFLDAFLAGLVAAGVDAVDLGILPTPMIYFAKRHLAAEACAIVTASHNPAETNGLKWMIGRQPPTEGEIRALQRAAEAPSGEPNCTPGTRRTLDVANEYLAWLKTAWADGPSPPAAHVVLDPMHGCWASHRRDKGLAPPMGGLARSYLKAVFPRARFSAIHDTAREDFGGRSPDCARSELLDELCQKVRQERADLGVAFDGDGDRVALVDGEGTRLLPEETTYAFLQSFGTELAKERFVYDLKFSDRVPEAAAQLGAEPVAERSGHAFIRARMIRTAALFGAEISGHYFFGLLEGGDDGLYAACRLIAYLARCGKTLAEVRRACPAVFLTPDLRLSVRLQEQQRVIEHVRTAWSHYRQTTIDGVRVDFPDGWALVRSSVTEPALTFRFEASDWPGLEQLVRRFCDALPELGGELWTRYEAAMRRVDQRG